MKNVGFAKVSFRILEEAMHMPPDHRIRSVIVGWNFEPFVKVVIEGPQMPEHQVGNEIGEGLITLRKNEIGWIKVEHV